MPLALAANALTTLQAVKDALNITDTSKDDMLTRGVNAASDSIEKYCNRQFARNAAMVENVAGFGTELIHLARTPVESIASVVINGVTVDPSEYYVKRPETGSVWRSNGWAWTAGVDVSASPHRRAGFEELAFTVTYAGGFALAQNNRTPGTYPQPSDLEEACIHLAVYRFRKLGRDVAVQSEQIGRTNRAYVGYRVDGPPDIPPFIIGTLDGYRRFI